MNHEIKHAAEKKALAFRSGHRVQQFTECLCVFVLGVCLCVCVCTYSGGKKKCQFAWLKVTVTVLASGHHFPDAKSACCWSGRLMSVVIAANTQTHTHPDAHKHSYTIKEWRTCLHKLKLTFKLRRCASINSNFKLNHRCCSFSKQYMTLRITFFILRTHTHTHTHTYIHA